jgi:hypothetical protein
MVPGTKRPAPDQLELLEVPEESGRRDEIEPA